MKNKNHILTTIETQQQLLLMIVRELKRQNMTADDVCKLILQVNNNLDNVLTMIERE